jgi:hypothetical protein
MLTYQEIQNKPRTFKCLTGFSPQEFLEVLPAFIQEYGNYFEDYQQKATRQRRRGGGRKSQLKTINDKLLFILVYFQLYPKQQVLGSLFGVGQAQTSSWINRLTPILSNTLGYQKQLPAQKPCDTERVLADCPALEFLICNPVQNESQ